MQSPQAASLCNVLVPPTVVEHHRVELELAVQRVRDTMARHDLRDVLVAVERTGRYHHPVKRAFQAARFDVRIVHPFTTKCFRQPAEERDEDRRHRPGGDSSGAGHLVQRADRHLRFASRLPTPDTAVWGCSPDAPVRRDASRLTRERWSVKRGDVT